MRRLLVCFLLVLLSCCLGCQNQHDRNKAAAMGRWNSARVQLASKMARQQFETGQLAKAIVTVNQVIELAPEYPDGHLLAGQIYLEQGRFSLAINSFNRCLAIDRSNAEAQYHLGTVYERWKDLEKAFVHYDKASALRPDRVSYLRAVIEVQISRGNLRQALERLQQRSALVRNDVTLCLIMGEVYRSLEMHEKAVPMYRRAHNMSPGDVKIRESLAFSLHRVGLSQEALGLFEQLTQEGKGDGQQDKKSYLLAMGDCYMQVGDTHRARRCFEKVSRYDRLNPSVWTRLAQVAIARGDLKQAKGYALRAQSIQKDYPDALMVFGYIAMEHLQYDRARDLFQQVVKTQPRNGTAYCLLGKSLQYRGETADAEGCYAKALKIDPEDKLAQSLLRVLRDARVGASVSIEQN